MRPLTEQTILITGSTDGLGRETAGALAERGATMLVHGRDGERAERVAAELRERTGNDGHRAYVADLARLDDVRLLAAELAEENDRLDALVNNAGIAMRDSERRLSGDGHELTFAVNYLSHFLLTELLLPFLVRSAPARIVNVASVGQAPIDFDDPMLERGYEGFHAYAQSKLAQIMFTFELAERLNPLEVTVNALHPATLMDTKMVREGVRAGPLERRRRGAGAGPPRRLAGPRRRERPLLRRSRGVHRRRAGLRPRGPPAATGAEPAAVRAHPGGGLKLVRQRPRRRRRPRAVPSPRCGR